MSRIRLAILGVAAALLIGGSSNQPAGWEAAWLQGSWEITSVERDGEWDLQVGARMTFTGNEVKFEPKAVQFVDGTS
jgi:hypothetical protein